MITVQERTNTWAHYKDRWDFSQEQEKKIANQCWIPHSGKLTDVVMLEKIKLTLLMVTRQPHWHNRSTFSQILFWLLLLQTPFAHMTERSSWSKENSLEPHEPPKRLLVQACQFTQNIMFASWVDLQDRRAYRADWDVHIRQGRFQLHLDWRF